MQEWCDKKREGCERMIRCELYRATSNHKKVEVTIADITGKIIYTTAARETQKIEVNTKDYSVGVYVVQIQTADFIETKKLIVKK